ncbi:MAG: inositol-3-phosphate synthase, partial [Desulfohalobiaceae bacterium]|nr:inositol-3-phosphate synthase [Desulfohalobiaceae bacterium]
MTSHTKQGLLLLAAGVQGAIGSTLAVAAAALNHTPELILPYLMTADSFPSLGPRFHCRLAGWDLDPAPWQACLEQHGVLEKGLWVPYADVLDAFPVRPAVDSGQSLEDQVQSLKKDITTWKTEYPGLDPVFVNLLPAGVCHDLARFSSQKELYAAKAGGSLPDLAYVLAALESKIPVINFTPNEVEIPAVLEAAKTQQVPLAGRDGKTGQTYFKIVLASAFRARNLPVNGWYSLNILGNRDGANLMDPDHAACKLSNKTDVLENVLGYQPGREAFGRSTHKVRIDYYPPRGDAKEAWDVIDFEGIFGLPMSLRMNLQGRDSILAAPMVLDLARWMCVLQQAGRSGLITELALYFKKTFGQTTPADFAGQIDLLKELERSCGASQ